MKVIICFSMEKHILTIFLQKTYYLKTKNTKN